VECHPHLDPVMVEGVSESEVKVGPNERTFRSEEKGEGKGVSAT